MKRKLLPVILLGVIIFSAAAALADGDFYSGGPWGTRITSLPYHINTPGAYYLGGNLSCADDNGIYINSDNVTLDLMGFTLTGPDNRNGIYLEGRKNVEIRNGTVSGWYMGIYEGMGGVGYRIINVRAQGNHIGIYLIGWGHLIKGCQAIGGPSSSTGIYLYNQGTITGCLVSNFFNFPIYVYKNAIITGNVVIGSGGASAYGGIIAGDGSLVMGNEVTNAPKGIYCMGAASVIGNTVSANPGQIGITVPSTQPAVLDQNTVMGGGTHYQGITPGVTVTRNNAG